MTTLYRYVCNDATLADCLRQGFNDRTLTGFCQTPQRLFFLTWDAPHAGFLAWDGQTLSGNGPADLHQVYEARFFDQDGELRWLRNPETAGQGRGAWLSEVHGCPCGFEPIDPLDALEPLDRLLGDSREDSLENGIVTQTRAQLPRVPLGGRGKYLIREYIGPAPGQAGAHGNMIVAEQRILGIVNVGNGDE